MITGIVFFAACFYVYRYFSEIAFEYRKNRIGFGFAGVGFFIAAYFIIALFAGLIIGLAQIRLEEFSAMLILPIVVFGLAMIVSTLIGRQFRNYWNENNVKKDNSPEIIDQL